MSKVDSNKSGGCPFLDTSYVYKTYAVPALFSEEGTSNEFNLDLFLGLHCCIFSFEFGSCMSCKIYYAQPFFFALGISTILIHSTVQNPKLLISQFNFVTANAFLL